MAYIYCDECEGGLKAPTLRQILTHTYECPHCGTDCAERIDKDEYVYAMDKLIDRIEYLEEKLNG